MYGISNSQQQGGGGGGGAASYKAIKSTLTPSDWQEVEGATPFFVGENAMEWAVNEEYGGMKIKSSPSALGLQLGVDYTATINVDNVTYTQTAQLYDPSEMGGMKVLVFGFSEDLFMYIYDDVAGIMPGVGDSFCAVPGGLTVTSFVVTNFEGEGFGTTIQATIADSAIEVNSAVTMYINTSEKIAVGEKTNGSITLTAPSVPNVIIPYSLEIVGTDTEGLFEIVNGYVPAAGITDYDGLQNVPIVNDVLNATDFTPVVNTYYRHTGETNADYTKGAIYKCIPASRPNKPPVLSPVLSADEISEGVDSMIGEFAGNYLPLEKTISNTDADASTKVSTSGDGYPYTFRIDDSDVYPSDFVRLYPMDAATETWLNEHTVSSIITEEVGSFTFKVDSLNIPETYSFKYIIECR